MPIPKRLSPLFGRIIGHLQNEGYSHDVAKAKTDKAIEDHYIGKPTPRLTKKRKKK